MSVAIALSVTCAPAWAQQTVSFEDLKHAATANRDLEVRCPVTIMLPAEAFQGNWSTAPVRRLRFTDHDDITFERIEVRRTKNVLRFKLEVYQEPGHDKELSLEFRIISGAGRTITSKRDSMELDEGEDNWNTFKLASDSSYLIGAIRLDLVIHDIRYD